MNERFTQKNERFAHWLIFGEQPERFAHIAHFGEQPERFTHIAHQKRGNEQIARFFKKLTTIKNVWTKNMILVKTFKANCLFFVSERANE